MCCPSHEVGQGHAKNILKEWRSLSLGRHMDPGTLSDARARAREQLWRLRPRQGREHRRGGGGLEIPDCTGQCWTRALENNASDSTQERVLHLGWPSTGSRCHMAGQDGEEDSGITVASGAMYLQQISMQRDEWTAGH